MVLFLLADGANLVCFCNLCKYRFTNSAFFLHVTPHPKSRVSGKGPAFSLAGFNIGGSHC